MTADSPNEVEFPTEEQATAPLGAESELRDPEALHAPGEPDGPEAPRGPQDGYSKPSVKDAVDTILRRVRNLGARPR